MKILITGITGYIGSKLALEAIEKGYHVHALVRNIPAVKLHPFILYFTGDVTNLDDVMLAMQGCDYVMHAAAVTQLWHKNPSQLYHTNVGGTRNILKAAKELSVKKLVFTSSCAVFGPSSLRPLTEEDPRYTAFENDYEVSKYCAEELVKEYSRNGVYSVIVCPPRVYGPGLNVKGNIIGNYIRQILRKNYVFIPSAKEVLGNYAFIDDVIEGHFLAMHRGLSGEKYILGGENISYKEFYSSIRDNASHSIKFIPLPKWLLKITSGIVYMAHMFMRSHSHLTPSLVDRLYMNRTLSCRKAIRQLGYNITPFREGIKLTIHHLNS